MPKLLLLDIDGTLVRSKPDAVPTTRLIEAIRCAQTLTNIALATGRSFLHAQPIIKAVGCFNGPSVFNGGSDIIEASSGEVIFRQVIRSAHLRELLILASPFGYNMYTDADNFKARLLSPDDIRTDASQFFIEAVKEKDSMQIVEILRSVNGVTAHLASSWFDGNVFDIHVTHELASKKHGVERIMSMYGVDSCEVMAIGDGFNDIPMLEASGFRVVMGDASKEVKDVADYVTLSLDDDGAADAIERFICGRANERL